MVERKVMCMINKCQHCQSSEDLQLNGDNQGKWKYICRGCNTKRLKKYRKTVGGRIAIGKATKKYEAKHPRNRYAWNVVSTKLRNCRQPCEICGELRVDAHHPDIGKPLSVIWLCRLHHKKIHKNMV